MLYVSVIYTILCLAYCDTYAKETDLFCTNLHTKVCKQASNQSKKFLQAFEQQKKFEKQTLVQAFAHELSENDLFFTSSLENTSGGKSKACQDFATKFRRGFRDDPHALSYFKERHLCRRKSWANADKPISEIAECKTTLKRMNDKNDKAAEVVRLESNCHRAIAEGLTQALSKEMFQTNNNLRDSTDDSQDLHFLQNDLQANHFALQRVQESYLHHTNPQLAQTIAQKTEMVKELLLTNLEKLAPSETKTQMLKKVRAIKFDGTNCEAMLPTQNKGDASLVERYIQNAYYDGDRNDFHYCNGMGLLGQSESAQIWTIAHELAHSIDPCNIAKKTEQGLQVMQYTKKSEGALGEHPFAAALQCLRHTQSVGAKPIKDSTVPFCSNSDQITEAFADLLAGEVVANHLQAKQKQSSQSKEQIRIQMQSAVESICEDGDSHTTENQPDEHPTAELRINRLFLANKALRDLSGCLAEDQKQQRNFFSIKDADGGVKYCPLLPANVQSNKTGLSKETNNFAK